MSNNGEPVEDDGIKTVNCPQCSTSISVSLPLSAKIETITTAKEDNSREFDASDLDRPRENQWQCPDGHTVEVLYDW